MSTVTQRSDFDCVFCCLAMVLGITYEEAEVRAGAAFMKLLNMHRAQGNDSLQRGGGAMAEALRVKQRGFAIPQLMLVLAGVGLAVALLLGGYHAGGNAERAKSQKQKLADIAAGQQRDAAVSSALADQHDRRALAEERAAKAEAQSKETRNAARRNRLVLGSCLERPETPAPARADAVAGEPAGSGVVADRGPARDAGVRLYWRFVGLHDGAFTGISGEPLFRDSAQFAGDPARADTASPYGLDDVAEVAAENASALSTCRRAYFGALDTLRAAESAYGKGP